MYDLSLHSDAVIQQFTGEFGEATFVKKYFTSSALQFLAPIKIGRSPVIGSLLVGIFL